MVKLPANEEFDLEQKRLNQLIYENNNWNSSLSFGAQLGIIATNISGEESILVPSPAPLQKMHIFALLKWVTAFLSLAKKIMLPQQMMDGR